MALENLLCLLEDKDSAAAFETLKELERLSDTSDELYPYINKFLSLLDSESYVMRVRGFRLFCKQAKWDIDDVIEHKLDSALKILNDEKPTAVRQALTALHEVVRHKGKLHEKIRCKVLDIDFLRYKDTMHSLIAKDIDSLLKAMDAG